MINLLSKEKKPILHTVNLIREIDDFIGRREFGQESMTSIQLEMCLRSVIMNKPKMNDLVDAMNISTSTLYRAISKLEEYGLCEKVKDAEDGRIRRLIPTKDLERIIKNIVDNN